MAPLSKFTSSVTNVNVFKESNTFVWNVQLVTDPVAMKTYKSHLQKRLRNINALCIKRDRKLTSVFHIIDRLIY